jgi:hypothetical protein
MTDLQLFQPLAISRWKRNPRDAWEILAHTLTNPEGAESPPVRC